MLWAKGGEVGSTAGFWGPYAFRFPASGSPGHPHIDLHVACEKDDFQGFVTILYTVP
jgi:hypothetical protein